MTKKHAQKQLIILLLTLAVLALAVYGTQPGSRVMAGGTPIISSP